MCADDCQAFFFFLNIFWEVKTMRGNQNNADLRQTAKNAGVCFWQIADLWGVSEAYMTRFMRRDLTEEERSRFLNAVQTIASNEQV